MKHLKLSCIALLIVSSTSAISQSAPIVNDPFAELDQEMEALNNEGSASEMEEFESWKSSYLAEYQSFRKEHFQRVDDIRDNLISLWGEAETSSPTELVEYSEDQLSKAVIDYEKNEVRISVLHDEDEKVTKENIAQTLENIAQSSETSAPLTQLLGEELSDKDTAALITKAKVVEDTPEIIEDESALLAKEIEVIEAQSQAQKSQVEKIFDLTEANVPENKESNDAKVESKISQEKALIEKEKLARIEKLKSQAQKFNKENNAKRNALKNKRITTYTIPLAKQKDIKKAQPFINDVKQQSERWDLSPSLLLAIMHTESYFNPKAQSHIPAFGLMQIVPRTAGVDVNRFLFKKDEAMSQSYLFKSDKNIETGVAYMHILNSRYLRAIKNPESRMYCMIAAYNTGSGNVAKTFNKDKSRKVYKAAKIINELTPQEVYDHLIANLPYDETKHYVERVVRRKNIYTSIDSI